MNSGGLNFTATHIYCDDISVPTVKVKDELKVVNGSGDTVFQVNQTGDVAQTGGTVYYQSGDNISDPGALPRWTSGLLPDGTWVLQNNDNNHISMYADPLTNQITFDPPISTGPWNGYATSILDMNGFAIVQCPTISQVLTVDSTNHITVGATDTYVPSSASTITISSDATHLNTPDTIVARDANGDFSSNLMIGTSTVALDLAGGLKGSIPVQDGASDTVFIANGSSGQILTAQGPGNLPIWSSASTVNDGELSVSSTNHITGSATFTANQATNSTLAISCDGTNLNTVGTLVARDGAGNFSAGTITATLTGTATSATNISGGIASQIPYQTAPNTTSFIPNGTIGQVLTSAGTAVPTWSTLTIGNGTLSFTGDSYLTPAGTFSANQSLNASISLTTNATSLNTPSTIVARDGTGNFTAGTITATLNGNASSATQVNVQNTNTNNDRQIPFLTSAHAGAGNYGLAVDTTSTNLTYNASTNVLNPTNLSLPGTFADATSSVGTSGQILSSTVTGTDWIDQSSIVSGTASTITIADNNTNASFYPTFVSNNTGALAVYVDKTTNPLTYNPSTGTMTSTNFTVSGTNSSMRLYDRGASPTNYWDNWTTATNYLQWAFNGAVRMYLDTVGGLSLDGTNASVYLLSQNAASTDFYKIFTTNAADGLTRFRIQYRNGSTGIASTVFELDGLTSTIVTGSASKVVTTSTNAATLCYPTFATTAGSASLFIDDTTGPLTYTPSNGNLTTLIYSSQQTIKTNTTNAATKRTQCFVRTSYPTTVGTAGDMFTVNVGGTTSSYVIEIEMVNSILSNSKARKFIIPCIFGNTGGATTWKKVLPLYASTDSANEIELQTASLNNLQSFRIVRRAGTTTPDVQLWVTTSASLGAVVYGDTTAIATSVDATVYAIVRSTNICQTTNSAGTSNYTGILTDTPTAELDVVGTVKATNMTPTTITDSTASVGTSGQVLSSTGSAVTWVAVMGSFTPTYSTPTLTLPLSGTFSTGTLTMTGSTNTISAISFTGAVPVNRGQYTVYIYNGGSGATTITNGSSSTTQRYTFTSLSIDSGKYGILSLVFNTVTNCYLISGAAYNN